jgi:hypothetical protein
LLPQLGDHAFDRPQPSHIGGKSLVDLQVNQSVSDRGDDLISVWDIDRGHEVDPFR